MGKERLRRAAVRPIAGDFTPRSADARARRWSSSAAAARVSFVSEEVPMKTKSKVKAGTSHHG